MITKWRKFVTFLWFYVLLPQSTLPCLSSTSLLLYFSPSETLHGLIQILSCLFDSLQLDGWWNGQMVGGVCWAAGICWNIPEQCHRGIYPSKVSQYKIFGLNPKGKTVTSEIIICELKFWASRSVHYAESQKCFLGSCQVYPSFAEMKKTLQVWLNHVSEDFKIPPFAHFIVL